MVTKALLIVLKRPGDLALRKPAGKNPRQSHANGKPEAASPPICECGP